jgi:twitching motility two-component system response regulator PilG
VGVFVQNGIGSGKEAAMAKKEILIVEDEESLLKLQSLLLASRGYSVNGVTDGKMALDWVARKKPDLVLLDIMIPEIDGFEVCRQIKSEDSTKDILVIMVTAKKRREDMDRGAQVGADGYITKPFKSLMLIEEIQRLFDGGAESALCLS